MSMRCDHKLIYEGVTSVECGEPGCENFDPSMNNKSLAVMATDDYCFAWGEVLTTLHAISTFRRPYVITSVYKAEEFFIIPLDYDKLLGKSLRATKEIIEKFRIPDWDDETMAKVKSYVQRAIELGKERMRKMRES